MKILDLFCGAGGCSMGLHRAFPNAEIVGVDIADQPRYPFEFVRMDAMKIIRGDLPPSSFLHPLYYDYVHASPPCQAYLAQSLRAFAPDYVREVVQYFKKLPSHIAWSIENVVQAPINNAILLCGTMPMFPELRVIRHRIFLTNPRIPQPPHLKKTEHPLCYTRNKKHAHFGKLDQWKDYVSVVGGAECNADAARDAMGIDWMGREELAQAVPPAYMEYIGGEVWTRHSSTIACAS